MWHARGLPLHKLQNRGPLIEEFLRSEVQTKGSQNFLNTAPCFIVDWQSAILCRAPTGSRLYPLKPGRVLAGSGTGLAVVPDPTTRGYFDRLGFFSAPFFFSSCHYQIMGRNSSSRNRAVSESVDRVRAQLRLTIGCVPNHSSAVDATMADSADEPEISEQNTGDGYQPTISRIPTLSATSSMSQKPITKAKGDIWEHIERSKRDENGRIVFSWKCCKKKWDYSEDEYRKNRSSTGNQRRHLNSMHKKVMQGNSCVGPLDAFISKVSDIKKRLDADPTISDRLIRECIEDFVISETEAFTIVESQPFLTLLKLCLKWKRCNVFLPKADALRNGVVQRKENLRTDLKETLAREESAVNICLDIWTSANQFSLLAVTAHYVHSNCKLTEKLLSFVKLQIIQVQVWRVLPRQPWKNSDWPHVWDVWQWKILRATILWSVRSLKTYMIPVVNVKTS